MVTKSSLRQGLERLEQFWPGEKVNFAKAELTLAFNSEKEANAIYEALEPEARAGPTDRAKVTLHHDKKKLELNVQAKDASAFRACIYTYSRWIRMAKSLSEV